jgi:hypothetical protein
VSTVYFNSIELEWSPPPQNALTSADAVTYYVVKYRPFRDDSYDDVNHDMPERINSIANNKHDSFYDEEDSYVSINTTSTKLRVGNNMLKSHTQYEFKLLAANLLGFSKETDPLVVRTAATSKHFTLFRLIFCKNTT